MTAEGVGQQQVRGARLQWVPLHLVCVMLVHGSGQMLLQAVSWVRHRPGHLLQRDASAVGMCTGHVHTCVPC